MEFQIKGNFLVIRDNFGCFDYFLVNNLYENGKSGIKANFNILRFEKNKKKQLLEKLFCPKSYFQSETKHTFDMLKLLCFSDVVWKHWKTTTI